MGKPFFKYEHDKNAHCNLEIIKNLIICSERPDNEGASITNRAETIATDVCKQFAIPPYNLIYIEHYPEEHNEIDKVRDESWDLVFFNLRGGGIFDDDNDFEFSNPRWIRIPKQIVETLRQHVKTS